LKETSRENGGILCLFHSGWPDDFVKKRPKCSPRHFFVKINTQLFLWQKLPQNLNTCEIFNNCQSKQSPKRRKIAQSGHPFSITCRDAEETAADCWIAASKCQKQSLRMRTPTQSLKQGCQIYRATMYQNVEKYTNRPQDTYTNRPQNRYTNRPQNMYTKRS
jgi:hypothetical protein